MTRQAHPWMPVSPCGDGCLPAARTLPAAGQVRRLLRLMSTALLLLSGVVLALVLPLLSPDGRERALLAWSRALLGALRVRLEITGGDRFARRGAGVLVVSNHVSWLDIVVLGAVQPLRMVAKTEVRDWPGIGLLARRAGTIFVHRERLRALPRTVAEISGALRGGAAVGAFPEGTTWCGMASGRFRPAVFQAAADTATPVRPVALRYHLDGAGTTTVAAFVGSATLWRALVLLTGVRGLVVQVQLLPLISAHGADRRTLAAGAGAAVGAATVPSVPEPMSPELTPVARMS
ncbi:MAG TPA: lysophospholipid acyltransferase family protein [Pseudonocardiaceae bacterium]